MTPEYIERIEAENDSLRKEVTDLTSQVANLKSENDSLKSKATKSTDTTIMVDGRTFNISSLKNMFPLTSNNEVPNARRSVAICTTCLTVGLNDDTNMICKLNTNVTTCSVCQARNSFVYTIARWSYFEKTIINKVSKKGWFGRVKVVDETTTDKIYRWYFFNER